MEIEIQQEGKDSFKHTLDLEKLGLVTQDKVNEIRNAAYGQGAEKIEKEKVALLIQERDALQEKLNLNVSNLSQKEKDANATTDRLALLEKGLKESIEKSEQSEQRLQTERFNGTISEAVRNINFVKDGQDVFYQFALKQKENGGFILDNGIGGTIDQLREQWIQTAVGKALIVSDQKGGTGSQKSGELNASFSEIMKNPELKNKFIDANGMDKYKQEVYKLSASSRKP